jgi:hypothetical protein
MKFFREGNVKMRVRGRLARPRADRRNTVDCAILNQMIIEPNVEVPAKRAENKRASQLIRVSERDIKMAGGATVVTQRTSAGVFDDHIDLDTIVVPRNTVAPTTVCSNCIDC